MYFASGHGRHLTATALPYYDYLLLYPFLGVR